MRGSNSSSYLAAWRFGRSRMARSSGLADTRRPVIYVAQWYTSEACPSPP
jgi:hypothetical protein